jgi:hypothetical protein
VGLLRQKAHPVPNLLTLGLCCEANLLLQGNELDKSAHGISDLIFFRLLAGFLASLVTEPGANDNA